MLFKAFIPHSLKPAGLFCLIFSFVQAAAQLSPGGTDSITVAIAPEYDKVGKLHRFWLGEGYRKLWAAPVKMKLFYLEKEKGGLTIVQSGGGLQTKSLRLKDARGKEWVLRSIQKYPERALPEKLRKTVAKDILQDQVITSHPYAAFTVPPFAEALHLPHSSPQVVFVPDDSTLGNYRREFGNTVLLFEEREPVDTLRTDNTEKAQRKLREDNDWSVNQHLVLRARLLDLLLGDWDRHEDQWRWERIKEKNQTVYVPVPRDRDKVYYNSSGVLPWALSNQWLKSNIQDFHNEIRDINGYNFNNRYFDRYFLTSLSEEDWKEQVDYVQKTITDSLIRSSIGLLPDTIYALSGEKVINTLIRRRKALGKQALDYYRFISRYVDVTGSDKHELFEIKSEDSGRTLVTIYKIKKDRAIDKVIYNREFDPGVTKEIRLYGFGGNDVFSVSGAAKSPIKIRMVGGDGTDSFYVNDNSVNRSKLYVYDRSDEENILPLAGRAKLRTSTDSTVNSFDKRAFKYDRFGPIVLIQYNLDQGLLYRLGILYEKQGFKKEPYAAKHEFFANYSSGRRSFLFTYSADIKKFFGKNDLGIHLLSRGPHNVSNFFGIGNETKFNNSDKNGIVYYRNRYDYINADIRIKRSVSKSFNLSGGLAAQYYTSSQSNNQNSFLNEYNAVNLNENVFRDHFYGGLVGGAEFNTRSDVLLPSKGLNWNTEARVMKQLNEDGKTYGQVFSEFSFYLTLLKDSNIVLANRVGGGTTFGKPAFFQQMQLGGLQNLRGYHSIRFTGKTILYHNVELRLKLFDFTSYLLPGTVGLIGFNDLGRVWAKGESSNTWHNGYGGGLYIIPADLVLIQAVVGHSAEGNYPYITFGLRF